jgi:outer membrane protein OmpA-like peptidoglycan-associated protein
MYRWKPSKWLKWAPVMAGLPALAAYTISSPQLWSEVEGKVKALAQEAGGAIEVKVDRRDVTLKGEAPSQDAVDVLMKSVSDTYGVRTVKSELTVKPKAELKPATAPTVATNKSKTELSGTWQQEVAKSLAVSVAGKTYTLGKDPELTTANGQWTLKPASIADGEYDVKVEVAGDDPAKKLASTGKLTIDTVAPAQPALMTTAAGAVWPFALKGTWPESDAKEMSVKLLDKTYTLGKDPELVSDGKGNFTFAPTVKLDPGSYDLNVAMKDAVGNASEYPIKAAIVIPKPNLVAELPAPTVASIDTTETATVIKGTWPTKAPVFTVDLDGRKYVLGKDSELQGDSNGNWTLTTKEPLAPGKHFVLPQISDENGNIKYAMAPTNTAIEKPVVKLAVPTVTQQNLIAAPYEILGTWDSANAKTLAVTVNGKTYATKQDAELSVTAGNGWKLTLDAPPADGAYDVAVTTTDGETQSVADATKDEIVVDAVPPAPPTVAATTVKGSPVELKGTWSASEVDSLLVRIPSINKSFDLKAPDKPIMTANNNWTVKLADELPPGRYDVVVETRDKFGRSQIDASRNELVVEAPPAPEPAPEPQKVEVPPLAAPTVNSQVALQNKPTITGTWPAAPGNKLSIKLAGNTYGTDAKPGLRADPSGAWSLSVAETLPDGTYDVSATVTSETNQAASDQSASELQIAAVEPQRPTVTAQKSAAPAMLQGTYDSSLAIGLSVSVPALNLKSSLVDKATLSAKGNTWTLKLPPDVKPGSYDVIVESIDKHGRKQADQTSGELVIEVTPAPAPAQPEVSAKAETNSTTPAYDCAAELDRLAAESPIRFEFMRSRLVEPYEASIKRYAALLADPRCSNVSIQITGHADQVGKPVFNQYLSEYRAKRIARALQESGISASRIRTSGLGESALVDTLRTEEARLKNRRVEITVIK